MLHPGELKIHNYIYIFICESTSGFISILVKSPRVDNGPEAKPRDVMAQGLFTRIDMNPDVL